MKIEDIIKIINSKYPITPETGIILGSGLGGFTDSMEECISISYKDLPGYPLSTIPGHAGEFILGNIGNKSVVCAKGRFHHYEGHHINTVTLPIDIFHALGCKNVVISNAAGCINKFWNPGELMLITKMIDFTFRGTTRPIIIENQVIDQNMKKTAIEIAKTREITLHEGTYTWTLGPSYETPSEIHMIKNIFGDAVGMSTFPEIKKAISYGMKVLGLTCLSNYAAGINPDPLTHKEVLEVVKSAKHSFNTIISKVIS